MCFLAGSTLYLPAIFTCDSKSGINSAFMKYDLSCQNTGTGIKNQSNNDKLKKLPEQIRTQFNNNKGGHI